MIKTLIVDDEELARRGLEIRLQSMHDIQIVAQSRNGREALHPWMKAYVIVSEHPYATVTDAKGRFTLQGLAAGEYVVEAWHSSLGTTEQTVTVADGEATTLDLTLAHR